MKTYLLSAAGVIFLSVVISLLVPEGKLNKTVTFVMRLICIFVLIQPITGIFKIGANDKVKDTVDYEYVSTAYSNQQSEQLEKLVFSKFGAQSECDVTVEHTDKGFEITDMQVRLFEKDEKLIENIYAYLRELGYINITVYAESA